MSAQTATGSAGNQAHAPPALYWGAALLFALLGVASLWLAGPQVEADEGSYLLSAAVLAGLTDANPAVGYYSGYSLFLLPAFFLQSQPDRIYHLALFVNAALVASTPFAMYRMTRLLWPSTESSVHAMAALVAICYAPVLMLSQHTMSENALVPLHAWLLAGATAFVHRHTATPSIGLGAAAGLLFLVHPRGATMAAPVLLAVTAFAVMHRQALRLVCLAWLVALSVGSLHGVLEEFAGRTSGGSGYSIDTVLTQLTTLRGWGWLLANLIGATTEAIVAAFGLPVVAGLFAWRELRNSLQSGDRFPTPRATILVAAVAAFATAVLVTAAFFVPPVRADMLSYGRYALPTLVPLLAIGVIAVQADRLQRLRDIGLGLCFGVLGIACTAVAFSHLPAGAASNWNFINSITLFLAQRHIPLRPWFAIAIFFTCAIALLYAALRHSSRRASVSYASLNIAIFATAWLTITLPGSRFYSGERHVVEAVREFAAVAGKPLCATLMPGIDAWHRPDFGWRLAPYMRKAKMDCVPAKIQPVSAKPPPQMQLAAVERGSPLPGSEPVALFIGEGNELGIFSRSHSLPSATAISRLAPEDRQAEVTIEFPRHSALAVAAGKPLDLQLWVTNRGGSTLSTGEGGWLPYPVLAGAYVHVGNSALLNYRAKLPRPIARGESVLVGIRIGPFAQAGDYPIHVGIVQEHVAWFDGGVDATLVVTP